MSVSSWKEANLCKAIAVKANSNSLSLNRKLSRAGAVERLSAIDKPVEMRLEA